MLIIVQHDHGGTHTCVCDCVCMVSGNRRVSALSWVTFMCSLVFWPHSLVILEQVTTAEKMTPDDWLVHKSGQYFLT